MTAISDRPTHDAVMLDAADTVATALRRLDPAEEAQIRCGTATRSVALVDAIDFGHKIALRDIAAGEPVLKYGCQIGRALVDIPAGAHVHTHNLVSNRARKSTND